MPFRPSRTSLRTTSTWRAGPMRLWRSRTTRPTSRRGAEPSGTSGGTPRRTASPPPPSPPRRFAGSRRRGGTSPNLRDVRGVVSCCPSGPPRGFARRAKSKTRYASTWRTERSQVFWTRRSAERGTRCARRTRRRTRTSRTTRGDAKKNRRRLFFSVQSPTRRAGEGSPRPPSTAARSRAVTVTRDPVQTRFQSLSPP